MVKIDEIQLLNDFGDLKRTVCLRILNIEDTAVVNPMDERKNGRNVCQHSIAKRCKYGTRTNRFWICFYDIWRRSFSRRVRAKRIRFKTNFFDVFAIRLARKRVQQRNGEIKYRRPRESRTVVNGFFFLIEYRL